jgi:hypothetical protein
MLASTATMRIRSTTFSIVLLLCLFDDEEEEEAEEESLPFRISTKQIEYALGKKWRKNSTQKDSHKI